MTRISFSLVVGLMITMGLSFWIFSRKFTLVNDSFLLKVDRDVSAHIHRSFDPFLSKLNRIFRLSSPIVVRVHNGEDSYFDPEEWQISLGVGGVLFAPKEGAHFSDQNVVSAMHMTLLHELGHAILFDLDVPELGNQEQEADTFATIVMMDVLERPDRVLEAARILKALDAEYDAPLWGEHPLDLQRYYDMMCLLLGQQSGLDLADDLAAEWVEENQERCSEAYELKFEGWLRVLEPVMY